MSSEVRCKLNSDGSVCLQDILESFNSPVREEDAWALCYQSCKFYQGLLGTNNHENYLSLTTPNHLFIQTDGNIHPNTLFGGSNATAGASRKKLNDEQHFIKGLALVIYQALDYHSNVGEERAVSQYLERLIVDMLSDERNIGEVHHETDYEGIEKNSEEGEDRELFSGEDLGERSKRTIRHVMRMCEKHLPILSKPQVEAHYKAVVRALVTEGLDLSTFLEKVVTDKCDKNSAGQKQLQFADWARSWMQVVAQLQMGVKLRKVNYSRAPIEYELTQYETLMKDIRTCRINLRKVMINGDIPSKVTKDAHTIILEFVRSRPKLKKVSDRKLPPLVRTLTLREQLMNSIKKARRLRPVKKGPTRKLKKINFSQLEDDDDEPIASNNSDGEPPNLWVYEDCNPLCEATLATQDFDYSYRSHRHTLSVIEQPCRSQSVPQSRPGSRQSCNSSEADSIPPEMSTSLQDHLIAGGKCWPEGMSLEDRLSLTLEEIIHIRSVLVKAELEELPVEGRVRGDVENRKVCFLCLKTRFGIFGPWGQRCIICKRTVCFRCYSKMNITMEQFACIAVALLSPSVLATPDEDHSESNSSRVTPDPDTEDTDNGTSPICLKRSIGLRLSEGSASKRFKTEANAVGKATGMVDKFKGSQLVVCHNCKMMLQQIIKSARTNRTAI